MSLAASQVIQKHVNEERLFQFDFSLLSEFKEQGETIASVNVVTAIPHTNPPLVFGTPVIAGSKVQFTIGRGREDESYEVTIRIVTSSGKTIIAVGTLQAFGPDLVKYECPTGIVSSEVFGLPIVSV
jgi:hypothetical protein